MLRYRPTAITITKEDVRQTKYRLAQRQADASQVSWSCRRVAVMDAFIWSRFPDAGSWSHLRGGTTSMLSFHIGPVRSRDDGLGHSDATAHTPQSASSGRPETASPSSSSGLEESMAADCSFPIQPKQDKLLDETTAEVTTMPDSCINTRRKPTLQAPSSSPAKIPPPKDSFGLSRSHPPLGRLPSFPIEFPGRTQSRLDGANDHALLQSSGRRNGGSSQSSTGNITPYHQERGYMYELSSSAPSRMPQLLSPSVSIPIATGRHLDPLAPTFVPHVRFGSVVDDVDADRSRQHSDRSHGQHLRVQTNSSPKSTIPCRCPVNRAGRASPTPARRPQWSFVAGDAGRRTSESDHGFRSGHLPHSYSSNMSPVLDRYPVLLPTSMRRLPHMQHSAHSRSIPGEPASASGAVRSRNFYERNARAAIFPRSGPGSPELGTIRIGIDPGLSQSVPNLAASGSRPLRIQSRRSSLNWSPSSSRLSSGQHVPSTSDTADRMSSAISSSLASFATRGPANLESSPLDELTERLQALAHTARGDDLIANSSGLSPRHRQALVNHRDLRGSARRTRRGVVAADTLCTKRPVNTTPPSPPAYAPGRLPSSPPLAAAEAQALPLQHDEAATPRSRYDVLDNAMQRATPWGARTAQRVPVYDDTVAASLQPQTPADARRQYDHPWRGSPSRDMSTTSSPRRRIYPSTRLMGADTRVRGGESLSATPATASFGEMTSATGVTQWRGRSGRRTRPSAEQENEFDPVALGLEADRDVWLNHRSGVDMAETLDVTPPREGRYERFLRD